MVRDNSTAAMSVLGEGSNATALYSVWGKWNMAKMLCLDDGRAPEVKTQEYLYYY